MDGQMNTQSTIGFHDRIHIGINIGECFGQTSKFEVFLQCCKLETLYGTLLGHYNVMRVLYIPQNTVGSVLSERVRMVGSFSTKIITGKRKYKINIFKKFIDKKK